MCGIAGFNFNNKALIQKMNASQIHRGPDGEGVYIDENISLGHRRLAIIDLSKKANQPMHFKEFSIVFNGEIYNFKEIKKDLIEKGHIFLTDSDTEVILHAYKEWNVHCLNHFNGMWAFCIYDRKKNELFLSRDRFGIKPLFYYFNEGKLIFASEIKAILNHKLKLSIDKFSLNYFFYQKYITDNRTIFNEIKKLKEAHYIKFQLKSGQLEIYRYYDLEKEIEEAKKKELEKRKKEISQLIPDAIEKRLIADVPVGSFLSGGIDSSIISASIAQKHPNFKVFSIGFNENTFNEIDYAKTVAQYIKVDHFYETLSFNEDFIFDTIKKIDEPFGDPSILPTALLSKITKKEVTVSLSGDAGDEIFGGYDTYKAWKVAKFFPEIFVKCMKKLVKHFPASDKNLHISFKLKKFIQDWNDDIQIRHLNWMSQTTKKLRNQILNVINTDITEAFVKNSQKGLLSLQLNDFNNYLPNDILRKVDLASMSYSLEARIPFLDHRLVPLALSLNDNLKIRRFKTKSFLKKNALNLIPKKIIDRKKAGFSVPLSLWFKKSEKIQSIIKEKIYFDHQLINYKFAQELLKEHLNGKRDNSRVLWLIFVFNLWYFENKNLLNPE